jgi:hypothetical protein
MRLYAATVGKSAGRLMNALTIIISFSDGTQFFKYLFFPSYLLSSVDMRGIYTYSCGGGEQYNKKTGRQHDSEGGRTESHERSEKGQ